jgi:hypothetical protein
MPVAANHSDVPLKVFVSSTSEDLKDHRAVARLAICDMQWTPRMMEHFGPSDARTVEACFEELDRCDLMILIVAFRRGYVPPGDRGGNGVDSITALELARARARNVPVLPFLASPDWPGKLWEEDPAAREWVKRFRADLDQSAQFFDPELRGASEAEACPLFRARLLSGMSKFRERRLAAASAARAAPTVDYFESARGALRSARCVPFLGHGIYGAGPLSAPSIAAAFGEPACRESSLVAAAECHENYLPSRGLFLESFDRILEEQARAAAPPVVHDLLLSVKRPPLIVSCTSDLTLERRLEAAGKAVTLVCHVIRSWDGEQDGKILTFRGLADPEPAVTLADEVDVGADRDRYVIYKPLGAPALHRLLDPDRAIDTVVATEADHLVFLRRLEGESTGVPTVFSRPLQQNPLLFLGYPMDVWNHRLMLQVFRSVGVTGERVKPISVREPASRMEEIAWQRIGAVVFPGEANAFAARVAAAA